MTGAVLEIAGVSKSFGAVRAAVDVTLDLRPGEIHALIGPNGAGKSTLIGLTAGALFADLNRFVSPAMFDWHTSGQIMVLVILGGVGRLYGPVAGAAIYIVLEHWLGGLSDYWQVFLGALLLAVVLFAKGGFVGALAGRERAHD